MATQRTLLRWAAVLRWLALVSVATASCAAALRMGLSAGPAILVGVTLGAALRLALPACSRGGAALRARSAPRTSPPVAAEHTTSPPPPRDRTRRDPGSANGQQGGDPSTPPKDVRPFEFAVCVGLHEDLIFVQDLTRRALRAVELVLPDPEPFAVVEAIGDFGVTLRVCGWVDVDEEWGRTRNESIRAVRTILHAAGIELPGSAPRHLERFEHPPRGATPDSLARSSSKGLPS